MMFFKRTVQLKVFPNESISKQELEAVIEVNGVQKMAYWGEEIDYIHTKECMRTPIAQVGLVAYYTASEATGVCNKMKLTIFHNWVPICEEDFSLEEFIKSTMDTLQMWVTWEVIHNRMFHRDNFQKSPLIVTKRRKGRKYTK